MPYDSVMAAKLAGATTEVDGLELPLATINAIADFKATSRQTVDLEASPKGTRTVPGVTILKEGVHVDRHGKTLTITPQRLQGIPEIYKRLLKLGFRPPVRLTHNPNHPVASGFPSLGWPDVPRAFIDPEDGLWTLESDFLGVPVKFADIMEAGGYDQVSSGLYKDVKVGDFTAPLAIDHVAVLGTSHPAVMMKGISEIHKLYENEMADLEDVEVGAAYLFEAGGRVSLQKEGGTMPMTPEQLAEYGVASETDLRAKLGMSDRVVVAEQVAKDKTTELEAAHDRMRTAAADGFIAVNRKRFPPALDDHFRALHFAATSTGGPVEFSRPAKDGVTQKVTLDPVASLTAIVAKFGTAIELEDEGAHEGGPDGEHLTPEEKATKEAAAKKAAEKKAAEGEGDPKEPKEGETDEVVELSRGDGMISRSKMAVDQSMLAKFIAERDGVGMGIAMGTAAVELARAGYGTDAYIAPDGLEQPKAKDK